MAFKRLYDLPQGFNQPTNFNPPPAYNPNGGGTSSYSGGIYKYAPPVQPRFGATGGTTMGQRQPASPYDGGKWATSMNRPIPPPSFATATPQAAPKVTPFLWNMFGSMRTMDVEQRNDYLQNLASGIKDKLDQYGLRLARGRALTPEQQAQYDSLRASFSDIQGYMTNQDAYDDYMTRTAGQTPEEFKPRYSPEELAAMNAKKWQENRALLRSRTVG